MNGWHSRPDEEGGEHGGRVIGKMQKNRADDATVVSAMALKQGIGNREVPTLGVGFKTTIFSRGDLMGPIRPVILTTSRQATFRQFRGRFEKNGRKMAYPATAEVHSVL